MYNSANKTKIQVSKDIFPAETWELISKNRERDDLVVIDVSTPKEYKDLHLEGAINVSLLSRFFKARLLPLSRGQKYNQALRR
ncbi:MAG: rhodanese-like domain-containing protein [Desulfobacteraceae bacterium]|nr:rhodanese-like domain-containing protein [Desulfobacteraceae bacterium]